MKISKHFEFLRTESVPRTLFFVRLVPVASHKKSLLVAHGVDIGARVLGAVSAGSRHVDRAAMNL
jgi:hypothetical protein